MRGKKTVNFGGENERRRRPFGQQALVWLLCACLMFASLPIGYGGGMALAAQRQEIMGFTELPQDVRVQNVDVGTPLEELSLPEVLEVQLHQEGVASPSEAMQDGSQAAAAIIGQVAWESEPVYDSETEGVYAFTPALPEYYTLAEGVGLPVINVAVRKGELTKGTEKEEGKEQNFAGKKTRDEKESLDKLEEVQGEWQELYAVKATPGCGVVSEDTTWEGDGTLEQGELVVEPNVTLTIHGALTVVGNVTIQGGGTIKRGSGDAKFRVRQDGNLTVKDVTLEGASIDSPNSMIEVVRGQVRLGDGCKIQNCIKTQSSPEGDYTVDGEVRPTKGAGGAALYLQYATAVFDNPVLQNNASTVMGGAVFARNSELTVYGGTYCDNTNTEVYAGSCIYNVVSKVNIYGGRFLRNVANTTNGKGGCILNTPSNGTELHLYGGYFEGNINTNPRGGGAIYHCAYNPAKPDDSTGAILELCGAVQFCGDGVDGSGVDNIYLEMSLKNMVARKIQISNTLSYPVPLYVRASEGYVIAEGTGSYVLQQRDMKRINFTDLGFSGKKWYAVLDKWKNQIYLSETDPNYGYYVYYISNGASGIVVDDNRYEIDSVAKVQPADGLEWEGHTFLGWNTEPDGSGTYYNPGDSLTIEGDTNLYAIFAENTKTYTANFYSGNECGKETKEISLGESENSKTIAALEPKELDGFTFVGWEQDNPSGYAGEIQPGEEVALTKEGTDFYGVYQKLATLSYVAEGAVEVPESEEKLCLANVHEEITYQMPEFTIASAPLRSGHIFQGWNTMPDGSGESIPAESVQKFGQDIVLYAVWEQDEGAVPYQVEHYKQDLEGDGYAKTDTENLMGSKGKEVEALPKEYAGFHLSNAHPDSILSGKLEGDGGLVLKLYYDRDAYTVHFDLNGGYGAKPGAQEIRYGGLLQAVEDPVKAGYSFKGWRLGDNGMDGGLWDFGSPVEENTAVLETTLYAKWADELAPQMGDASFSAERKDFLSWLIKKENLAITVPVLEEGSGMKDAKYTLVPEQGEQETGEAQVTKQHGLPANSMVYGSGAAIIRTLQKEAGTGKYEAAITIDKDFKGKVLLTCTDNAGNVSATKILTAAGGGVVVEDNAPVITFSNTKDRMSDQTVDVDVLVEDSKNGEVSGGIAGISYQIDEEGKVRLPEEDFQGGMVEAYRFTLNLSGEGEHTVQVYAQDNAGNGSAQQMSLTIQKKEERKGQNTAEKEEHDMAGSILENGGFGKPQKPSQPGRPIGGEPRTGGGAQVKVYATAAMVAGFGYLLLYFEGEHGISEERKEEIIYRLIAWAKGGGTIRRYAGLAMIVLFLAYYHSIGKGVDVEWKEVYGKRE